MSENPYEPPKVEAEENSGLDDTRRNKLMTDYAKLQRAKKGVILIIPIVAISTAMEYAGLFRTGFLPKWFGLVVIALCLIQFPALSNKMAKIERELARN